jgi:hypothetical protein
MGDKLDYLVNLRRNAIGELRAAVAQDVWQSNTRFIDALKREIRRHPVAGNAAIRLLNEGAFPLEQLQRIHLEYRHAIVQSFTDALLMAQFQSRQLEPRLRPGSKMAGRFLLTLNTLDEFGFEQLKDDAGGLRGTPAQAHYPLFERVLDDLQISLDERLGYQPSPIADALRQTLESSFETYADVVALLAVAEEEVILYSPPLRRATQALGVDVGSGYYNVHGTSEDPSADAADDDHEDDLWFVLAQALQPQDYDRIRALCLRYCDQWDEFWGLQASRYYDSQGEGRQGAAER